LKLAIETKLDALDPEWRSKCKFDQWEEEFHFTISEVGGIQLELKENKSA
jgi:hypothetical protein